MRDIQANVEVRALIGDDAACGLGLDGDPVRWHTGKWRRPVGAERKVDRR